MHEVLSNMLIVHIASLFIIAGIAKLIFLKQFLQYAIDFNVLPRGPTLFTGFLIPFFEVIGGFLLLQQTTWNSGVAILILLLLGFGYSILQQIKSARTVSNGFYGKWLKTDTDYFTFGKIVYLFFLLLYVSHTIPRIGINLSFYPVMTGLILTLFLIIAHKVWQLTKNTSRKQRKNSKETT